MAEGILFNLAGEIIKKLSSLAFQQLGMLWGVNDDLTKLTSSVSAIKAVLLDAEERQTGSNSLQDWLGKLKEALYDAEDVLDEISYEALHREVMTAGKKAKQVRIFFSKSNPVAFNYKMARQIKNVRERLGVIAAERKEFHFAEMFGQKFQYPLFDQIHIGAETRSKSNNEEVIGRDGHKRVIKDLLQDMKVKHNISFIAIVGMGGIGKTTLARSLFNDAQVSKYFDLKIWVWVSQNFEVKIVMEKIIESITESRPNVQGMESLQNQLQKMIQGKKYLLVMDDIWNESEQKWFDLKNLLMGGARGSKIMITKRDSTLAVEISNMTNLITLKGLSECNSWSLLKRVAFMDGIEPTNPKFIKVGKEIVVKCGGVPLIIRHIGRLLYNNTSEEEWTSFKNNQLSRVIQHDQNMIPILRLSYNYLPPNLKRCFAYSSLLLKHWPIHKDELIQQWMAQGFIQASNCGKSMEDIGNDYFMELCWRFFFEHSGRVSDSYIFVHDVMHDLAKTVAGNEYVCISSKNNYDNVSEKTRHVSFDHKIKSWWDDLPTLCKGEGLRTFLPSYYPYKAVVEVNKVSLNALFSSFPRLRVLCLGDSEIKIVPKSIEKLRQLRYLDLSGNENMVSLPNSISKLQHLETLNLKRCFALRELPRGTCNLVNLRHLYLPLCLTYMPEGMGKLTCLQTLSFFVLDNNREDTRSSKLSELNGLKDLRGCLTIDGLDQLRSNPKEASSANLKDKKGLQNLQLTWNLSKDVKYKADEAGGCSDVKVMEGLEPQQNVEYLSIHGYSGARLPDWMSRPLLKLTSIRIQECHRLQHLTQLNYLPSLREVILRSIIPVKFIDKNDPCPSSVFFPSLKTLCLENMPNLKGWWEKESTAGLRPAFPCLTTLSISNCPKLASIPEHPCLENLKLDDVGLQMMSSIGTSLDASQSSSSSSSLKSLNLKRIGDLENLPCKLRQKLTSLEYLHMEECHNLEKSLCDDHEATQWNLLHNLRVLWLWELRKLVSLPIEARHWTSLRYLIISKCPNLRSLPEWIGCLVSLHLLYIIDCPELKSLPEEMRQLKSLIAGCPDLEERCKEGGEDWPKISHVPHFSKYFYYFERGQDQDHGTANTAHASSSSDMTLFIHIRP
ncbi:putative disease resistance protein RGA4 [Benincasa hispida]|uniref:putative disease resistance protein RGA4 n=1 Tax=Benincasa hispida TaxID=102211 RepID=UPI0019011E80|nr:putative disease resistance protein RGA4 [Benincasa hispida]